MRNLRFKLEREDWVEGGSFSGSISPEGVLDTVQQNRIRFFGQRPAAVLK